MASYNHDHIYYLSGTVDKEIKGGTFYAYKFKCKECGGIIVNSGWLPSAFHKPGEFPKTYKQYFEKIERELKWPNIYQNH